MTIVYLSLGSNIENRIGYIQQAVSFLCTNEEITIVRSSAFYETEPWGNKNQEWFVNAVIEVKTKLSAKQILEKIQIIEEKLGRIRTPNEKWEPRTIDIDILFFGEEIINTENLKIPHPLLHKRAFVLVPLLELIPAFKHPQFGKSILELHEDLEVPETVLLYGTRI